jgi:hypothetical protein
MKPYLGLVLTTLFFATPILLAQEAGRSDHVAFGVFAEYFRFSDPGPTINYVGVGGRAAFNVHPRIQLEAEMGYDFGRNYSNSFHNGITIATVENKVSVLHGLFGPKFQTGAGAFRLFFTGKVGFENFNVTGESAPAGFVTAVGLGSGATYFAVYPGGGLEAFLGPIGLRAEVGDNIFFNNGAHNNLRVSLGPQFRF